MGKFFELGMIGLFLAVFTTLNARDGGWEAVRQGVVGATKLGVRSLPLIILLFLLIGESEVWAERYAGELKNFLGGVKGVFFGAVAGIFSPSVFGSFGIVRGFWEAGVNPFALIAFLFSAQLLAIPIVMFRLPFLGVVLTAWYFVAGAGVVIVMTILLAMLRVMR